MAHTYEINRCVHEPRYTCMYGNASSNYIYGYAYTHAQRHRDTETRLTYTPNRIRFPVRAYRNRRANPVRIACGQPRIFFGPEPPSAAVWRCGPTWTLDPGSVKKVDSGVAAVDVLGWRYEHVDISIWYIREWYIRNPKTVRVSSLCGGFSVGMMLTLPVLNGMMGVIRFCFLFFLLFVIIYSHLIWEVRWDQMHCCNRYYDCSDRISNPFTKKKFLHPNTLILSLLLVLLLVLQLKHTLSLCVE